MAFDKIVGQSNFLDQIRAMTHPNDLQFVMIALLRVQCDILNEAFGTNKDIDGAIANLTGTPRPSTTTGLAV